METRYPDDIKKLVDIFRPYAEKGTMDKAPKEAIEALEKYKKWAWEQGQ